MIVTCPSCAARYKLDDGKVTGRGAKIKCPSCRFVFIVYPQSSAAEEEEVAPAAPLPAVATAAAAAVSAVSAPTATDASGGSSAVISRPGARPAAPAAPRRSADSLDFRKIGIASWKVRVKFGLVYDFSDIRTLRKYIQDGKVTADDVISHDGQRWVIIGDIPDLDGYFVKVYEEAEEAQKSAKEKSSGFEDDESPTMIVGMGTLASDLAADALRQATAPSNPNTPGPATPSGDAQFVDPFAALKSKQRDRIQKRRAATASPVVTGTPSGNKNLPIIGVVLVALLAGGWWFTHREPAANTPPPRPVKSAGNTGDQTPNNAGSGAADDLRALVDNSLSASPRTDIAPEEDDEKTLVPVGPSNGGTRPPDKGKAPTNGGPGANPVTNPGITVSAPTAIDHVANCQDFAQRRDWSQAKLACAEASKSAPGNANVSAWYGMALYETGNAGTAAQKLGEAQRGGSSVREVRKYLGHIARDNGDSAGAIGHYQQYVNGNPPDKAAIEEEIRKLTGS